MIDRNILSFHVSGFTYYDGIDVIDELRIGSTLRIEAEPENKFDPYAVAVYYKETKIGFIPSKVNKIISQFLQLGYDNLFEVRVNRVSTDSHPEQQVGAILRIQKK